MSGEKARQCGRSALASTYRPRRHASASLWRTWRRFCLVPCWCRSLRRTIRNRRAIRASVEEQLAQSKHALIQGVSAWEGCVCQVFDGSEILWISAFAYPRLPLAALSTGQRSTFVDISAGCGSRASRAAFLPRMHRSSPIAAHAVPVR